jgi:Uma2 family endonuclease
MATLTIELPAQPAQTAFNLRRWNELLADVQMTRFEGRVETDRHGHVITSPPPAPSHGSYQARIAFLLQTLMPGGRVLTECPISTADGVKGADIAWASAASLERVGNGSCFPEAPEICIEVLSPGNTEAEINEKVALYFDAGAQEVWLCASAGAMRFLARGNPGPLDRSRLCPRFPQQVELP